MRALAVTYLAIADLKPYARNPRTHSKKQMNIILIRTYFGLHFLIPNLWGMHW